MPDTCANYLDSALEEALETMAFMSLSPAEDDLAPSGPIVVTRLGYSGVAEGTLELACSPDFGVALATTLLGDALDPALAQQSGADALRELVNVLCGAVLRSSGVTRKGTVAMQVPVQEGLDPADWDAFIARDATVADADGHKLAVRLV